MSENDVCNNSKSKNKLDVTGLSEESLRAFSRRHFLANGLAAAGTLFVPTSVLAATVKATIGDYSALAKDFGFKGAIVKRGEADFNKYAFGELWNKYAPNRSPDVLVRCVDEQDVVAAVKYAKANKIKVAVRGGGHNWCAPSLRNSGMMIDLTLLNKVISIDAAAKKAVVQPIISNREAIEHLSKHGLAFPTGHCPTVKLSGYILSGGMAWNQGTWGHGCESVEAIEMVTPDGEMITASATQNQDYFWAARGAGPGLFAVAVRYHLKLYDMPKAITASVYFYPYDKIVEVAEWLHPLASKLPASVELSLFAVAAPKHLADKCTADGGKVALVTATMFANTKAEAESTLKLLDTCPIISQCLEKSVAQPTTFPALFDASGAMWPGDLRCQVDAMFSNASLADMMKTTKDHFKDCQVPKTIYMFAIFTGPKIPAPLPADTAFSMTSKLYGGPWTQWDTAEQDKYAVEWHEQCVKKLLPLVSGHYVSESNTIKHPAYLKAAYLPENFEKIGKLRKKYDPTGVFFTPSEGVS